MEQLVFEFYEPSETEMLAKDFAELKTSCDKVRRAMFARHGDLARMVLDIHQRLEVIERHLCRNSPL